MAIAKFFFLKKLAVVAIGFATPNITTGIAVAKNKDKPETCVGNIQFYQKRKAIVLPPFKYNHR